MTTDFQFSEILNTPSFGSMMEQLLTKHLSNPNETTLGDAKKLVETWSMTAGGKPPPVEAEVYDHWLDFLFAHECIGRRNCSLFMDGYKPQKSWQVDQLWRFSDACNVEIQALLENKTFGGLQPRVLLVAECLVDEVHDPFSGSRISKS
jgi:hypothetical protein